MKTIFTATTIAFFTLFLTACIEDDKNQTEQQQFDEANKDATQANIVNSQKGTTLPIGMGSRRNNHEKK